MFAMWSKASLEQALRCDPSFFPTHLTAALLALLEGNPAAAERHAREAKRVNPELESETVERIVVGPAAEMLAAWLEAETVSD
jgi:hypothetical protein